MTPRQTKTPAERAQAALDVAQRRVDKAVAARKRLSGELQAAEDDVTEAIARRDYLALDPALPTPPNATDLSTTTDKEPTP